MHPERVEGGRERLVPGSRQRGEEGVPPLLAEFFGHSITSAHPEPVEGRGEGGDSAMSGGGLCRKVVLGGLRLPSCDLGGSGLWGESGTAALRTKIGKAVMWSPPLSGFLKKIRYVGQQLASPLRFDGLENMIPALCLKVILVVVVNATHETLSGPVQ